MHNFTLSINMFGEFLICNNNNEVLKKGKRSKKLWLLLAILIINRGRSISQDMLIEIIWHDIDKYADPANSLKNLVYRARTLLEDLSNGEKIEFIKFYNGAYLWSANINCTIDVEQMNIYINKALLEENELIKLQYYYKAINLYKGPFLQNIIEEEWVYPKRSFYESMYVKCILNSCEILSKQNQTEDIILLCEQAILHCPFQEDIHRILIESYIKMTHYSKALIHYENLVNSFNQELGIGIPTKIRTLYFEIIKNIQGIETDLNIIKRDLIKNRHTSKTFLCEYPIFQQIVNFEINSDNNLLNMLVLLTIVEKNGEIPGFKKLKNITANFQACISEVLSNNDIVSKYSSSQFIMALTISNVKDVHNFVNSLQYKLEKYYNKKELDVIYQCVKLKN